MASPQDVPGTQDGGVQPGFQDALFTLRADGDIALHGGRGMSHAHINEVADASPPGGVHAGKERSAVHPLKLRLFPRCRMRRAYQMDQRVTALGRYSHAVRVQGVAQMENRPSRSARLATRPYQHSD